MSIPPPKITIQGECLIFKYPFLNIVPQLGVGGLTPSPKKLNPASKAIIEGISIAAIINIGPLYWARYV